MTREEVLLQMQETPLETNPSTMTTATPLTIRRPLVETIPQMVKGTLHQEGHNSNVAHSYKIVMTAQSPSAMSAMEVLQTCPT